MDIKKMFDENEKPLENLVEDGGFCGIFRRIGCIGDSLASGEFESTTADGKVCGHDFFAYSWGAHMARRTGSRVYNFSRGGMTAMGYHSFANLNGFWWNEREGEDYVCDAYIIALGVNDILEALNGGCDLGSIDDVDIKDYNNNKDTFAGNYAKIISRLREGEGKCRIFLMTIPKGHWGEKFQVLADEHAKLIYEIAAKFDFCYVMDIRKYGAVYDEEFKEKFFLGDHMNPLGYLLTAKIVMSYMDFIIRHNIEDFKQVAFIGKPFHNENYKW